jgi:cell division septation protein DedD
MTQNSSGEKELVLGNRQLLSFFFVVVALCGVFFAIGYIIGRNSGKTPATEAVNTPPVTEGQRSPLPADTPPQIATPSETSATQPAQEQPAAPAPEVKTESPATVTAAPAPAPPVAAANRVVPVTAPEKGASYLQVTALARPDAEAVVRTLKEQGFPALLTESSREGFFRVLVGPYREAAQLSTGKDRLRALGFANTIVHKQP